MAFFDTKAFNPLATPYASSPWLNAFAELKAYVQ